MKKELFVVILETVFPPYLGREPNPLFKMGTIYSLKEFQRLFKEHKKEWGIDNVRVSIIDGSYLYRVMSAGRFSADKTMLEYLTKSV